MPQSAQLTEGEGVHSLFGQCPFEPVLNYRGASLTEDACDSPKYCELGTAVAKEPFLKEALICLLRPRNAPWQLFPSADVMCDATPAQPSSIFLCSHSGLPLGNPVALFCSSPMTQQNQSRTVSSLSLVVALLVKQHTVVLYIELI